MLILNIFINYLDLPFLGSSGDDRQSVAMKDLLDAIYPRVDRPDYIVRLEPIQTTTKAMFQYLTTDEELARYPSHTPRLVVCCCKCNVTFQM